MAAAPPSPTPTPSPSALQLPDIVVDTKLDIEVHADHTIHYQWVGDLSRGLRPRRVEEKWRRDQRIGKGGFGTVWVHTCTQGRSRGQCRAIKEIERVEHSLSSSKLVRELEAIGKFSQERVRIRLEYPLPPTNSCRH
jgi:hypothetical protein